MRDEPVDQGASDLAIRGEDRRAELDAVGVDPPGDPGDGTLPRRDDRILATGTRRIEQLVLELCGAPRGRARRVLDREQRRQVCGREGA